MSLARDSANDTIQACLKRPVSSDLAEMLAYRTEQLDTCLKLLLEAQNPGFANALFVLMAAIDQGTLSPPSAEMALARAVAGKKIEHVNLTGMRLENLNFDRWTFRSCDLNETQLVDCRFLRCDFSSSAMFGTLIIEGELTGSNFGDASMVNSLGVIQDDEIERLYDNSEIRLWLLSQNAQVKADDLIIMTEDRLPANELLEHIFRRFYPRGSAAQQRHILRTSPTKSLPSHRIAGSQGSWQLVRTGGNTDTWSSPKGTEYP